MNDKLDLAALRAALDDPGFLGIDWMERRLMSDGHYSVIQHRLPDGTLPALIEAAEEAERLREALHQIVDDQHNIHMTDSLTDRIARAALSRARGSETTAEERK